MKVNNLETIHKVKVFSLESLLTSFLVSPALPKEYG